MATYSEDGEWAPASPMSEAEVDPVITVDEDGTEWWGGGDGVWWYRSIDMGDWIVWEEPDVAPHPDGLSEGDRILPKDKIKALSIGLLIVSAAIGIMYLTGIIGGTIEREWYDGENIGIEFKPDGNYYTPFPPSSLPSGQWRIDGEYLFLDEQRNGFDRFEEEKYRFEIYNGWLFIGLEYGDCAVFSKKTMQDSVFAHTIGGLQHPDWCLTVKGGWASLNPIMKPNRVYAVDALPEVSVEGSDTLIELYMTGKDDLAWSFVKVTLSVGDNIYTCSVTGTDQCDITQSAGSNDNAWEPGESIFLSEDGEEICSAQGCEVGISVTNGGHTVAGDSSQTVN